MLFADINFVGSVACLCLLEVLLRVLLNVNGIHPVPPNLFHTLNTQMPTYPPHQNQNSRRRGFDPDTGGQDLNTRSLLNHLREMHM